MVIKKRIYYTQFHPPFKDHKKYHNKLGNQDKQKQPYSIHQSTFINMLLWLSGRALPW